MKSFPLALRRLLPPRAHLAAHLHPAAGAVLRRARSRRCTRQPKKNHSKNLHAPLLPPAIHCSTRGFPRGLPLPALLPSASWSPGRRRCRARCALAGTGAASRGARRSGRCRRHGGSQAEEGCREENGSGRRGTGARDPNPQSRSQRSLPGGAPTLVSAPSCRRRRYCSPPRCSKLSITADADARTSPSPSSPPLASLGVSSSTAREKGEMEKRASGMTSDLGARRRGEGAGKEGGCEGGAAGWRALPAPGLKAGLILELESSSTSLSGLEDNTNVPSCRWQNVAQTSESAHTLLIVPAAPQPRAEVEHVLLS